MVFSPTIVDAEMAMGDLTVMKVSIYIPIPHNGMKSIHSHHGNDKTITHPYHIIDNILVHLYNSILHTHTAVM